MKFSILQQDFLPKLQAVSRSVGIRSTLPVLDNILLAVEDHGPSDKKCKIAATNLEIGVIKYVSILDEVPGEITVPAKTLVELISGLGEGKITLESEGEMLTVSSGKFKAQVNGISAAEFPAIPMSSSAGIIFPKDVFLSSHQILYASAVDEGRPVLTGILTDAKSERLDFVATDGFRLAHRSASLPKGSPSFNSLIPKKTFEEVLRIISQENEVEGDIEGEELTIAFNAKFLQDAVSNIPTQTLMIEFSGSLSASLIKPVGQEGLEYIVMPVRLS